MGLRFRLGHDGRASTLWEPSMKIKVAVHVSASGPSTRTCLPTLDLMSPGLKGSELWASRQSTQPKCTLSTLPQRDRLDPHSAFPMCVGISISGEQGGVFDVAMSKRWFFTACL